MAWLVQQQDLRTVVVVLSACGVSPFTFVPLALTLTPRFGRLEEGRDDALQARALLRDHRQRRAQYRQQQEY
jgi:hypothetical protein